MGSPRDTLGPRNRLHAQHMIVRMRSLIQEAAPRDAEHSPYEIARRVAHAGFLRSRLMQIGVGIIGMGFMGRTHAHAYLRAQADGFPCALVAACDPKIHDIARECAPKAATPGAQAGATGKASGNLATGDALDLSGVALVTSADELLRNDRVQLVSVCTYTDTHVEVAARALRAGKHVLVEKPLALSAAAVEHLQDEAAIAARDRGTLCMPAMCMRFWPGWDWLRDRVRDGSLGALRSLTLQRMGAGPAWGSGFYKDYARSGGAAIDLHIHDADFVLHALGVPRHVSSTGTLDHITTLYGVAACPHVIAEGAWDLAPSAGFRMRYLANFEHASADFDLLRPQRLMLHDKVGSREVPLSTLSGYDLEVRHLVSAITRRTALMATMDEAVLVARLLEGELRSMRGAGERVMFGGG